MKSPQTHNQHNTQHTQHTTMKWSELSEMEILYLKERILAVIEPFVSPGSSPLNEHVFIGSSSIFTIS